jgi:phenylalanine-4-hydroxylase
MEFQAYNVIASDIRQLEHIEYTPAPDIIHEGAGHAPIIANPEYAEYLRRFERYAKQFLRTKTTKCMRLSDCFRL